MAGLQDYRALEWIDCTVAGNAGNELRPQKPFGQPAPVARFEAPAKTRVGQAIRFMSNSRSAAGRVTAMLWDFNDGAPASEVNPAHIYTRPGHYRVTLVVWDDSGRAARAEQHLEVSSTSATMADGASPDSKENR
ncbi:MAG: PKD domain-containing protein [Verrucomicrobiota bacterium]|jgi:PKD repeat protein